VSGSPLDFDNWGKPRYPITGRTKPKLPLQGTKPKLPGSGNLVPRKPFPTSGTKPKPPFDEGVKAAMKRKLQALVQQGSGQ
jgi:hypothetical protein